MPVKPKVPKSKPDTDAAPAGSSELVEIEYKGIKFIVPRDRGDWSTKGLAYLAEEKYNLFVKNILDTTLPGQWEVLVRLCPRRRDFAEFFTLFGQTTRTECIN